jgi:hypothetical protein
MDRKGLFQARCVARLTYSRPPLTKCIVSFGHIEAR